MAVGVFIVMSRLVRLGRADAAAFAAHYGSASAVTFAAAVAAVQRAGAEPEGILAVLLVILEVPAILVAIFLHRLGSAGGRSAGYGEIIHEVALNRSVFLLLAGIAVGAAVGPDRFAPFEPLFVGAFKPILAFFVLEMGLLAAHRLPELRRNGVRVGASALLIPLAGGALGGWAGLTAGLSPEARPCSRLWRPARPTSRLRPPCASPFPRRTPACASPRRSG